MSTKSKRKRNSREDGLLKQDELPVAATLGTSISKLDDRVLTNDPRIIKQDRRSARDIRQHKRRKTELLQNENTAVHLENPEIQKTPSTSSTGMGRRYDNKLSTPKQNSRFDFNKASTTSSGTTERSHTWSSSGSSSNPSLETTISSQSTTHVEVAVCPPRRLIQRFKASVKDKGKGKLL